MLYSIFGRLFATPKPRPSRSPSSLSLAPCIGLVRGQDIAKQSLLIAAAGGHNLLMIGPPGEGKSFLASTLPGFLPPLSGLEAEELEPAYRASYMPCPTTRPYRAIGPTITLASLLGGGRSRGSIYPGELCLAHTGVLFIDELPQFDRTLIDALRSPLESGVNTVSRGGSSVTYPCRSLLLAAMNPCPCGYHPSSKCSCSPELVTRYQARISGPILDRIDLFTELQSIPSGQRFNPAIANQSRVFLRRVLQSRLAMMTRNPGRMLNNQLGPKELLNTPYDYLTRDALTFLNDRSDYHHWSTRKFIRVARVSRTIADLMSSELVQVVHAHAAISHCQSLASLTQD